MVIPPCCPVTLLDTLHRRVWQKGLTAARARTFALRNARGKPAAGRRQGALLRLQAKGTRVNLKQQMSLPDEGFEHHVDNVRQVFLFHIKLPQKSMTTKFAPSRQRVAPRGELRPALVSWATAAVRSNSCRAIPWQPQPPGPARSRISSGVP